MLFSLRFAILANTQTQGDGSLAHKHKHKHKGTQTQGDGSLELNKMLATGKFQLRREECPERCVRKAKPESTLCSVDGGELMKNKYMLRILIIIVVLLSLWGGTVMVDYYRAKQQQEPLFTFKTIGISDGGTIIKVGLGYQVIHYNQMPSYGGRTDLVFEFGWSELFNL